MPSLLKSHAHEVIEPLGVERSLKTVGFPWQTTVEEKFDTGLLGLPGIIVSREKVQGTVASVVMLMV